MPVVTAFLLTLFKSKWFWIGLAALIALIILNRQWDNIKSGLKRLTQRKDIVRTEEEIAAGDISEERKRELEDFAQELYAEIQGASAGTGLYSKLLTFTDLEVEYLSKYYRKHISGGVYLYEDVDEEWFSPFTNIDGRVMARLAKVGEKA